MMNRRKVVAYQAREWMSGSGGGPATYIQMMTLPEPTGAFRWTQTSAGPALCLRRACTFAAHLFTTRPWTSVGDRRGSRGGLAPRSAAAIGVDAGDLRAGPQVHGASVVVRYAGATAPRRCPAPDFPSRHSAHAGSAVALRSNCRLRCRSHRRSNIGAVAAGTPDLAWTRGRASDGGRRTRSRAIRQPSRRSDCGGGPSISAARYEVGRRRALAFEQTDSPPSTSAAGLRRSIGRITGTSTARSPRQDQLAVAGVPPAQIHVARLCTADPPRPSLLLRRDGKASGRMAAVIRALA